MRDREGEDRTAERGEALFPDKAHLYEIIYESRFGRLWEQFCKQGGDSRRRCSSATLQMPRSQCPDNNNLQDNHRRQAKQWNEKFEA